MRKLTAVLLMIVCTAFTSIAQVFYKIGASRLPEFFTNYPLLSGLVLYGIGSVIFIFALKGGDVTLLYPIIATSYIWVTILSNYFFKEIINAHKIAGIALIIIGISTIGYGSRRTK